MYTAGIVGRHGVIRPIRSDPVITRNAVNVVIHVFNFSGPLGLKDSQPS